MEVVVKPESIVIGFKLSRDFDSANKNAAILYDISIQLSLQPYFDGFNSYRTTLLRPTRLLKI